ncbi:hypothetical protein MHK_000304, partial [Candidatus Magnetomorum sp. HK-1]
FLDATVTITTELFEIIQSDDIFDNHPSDDEHQSALRIEAKNRLEETIKGKEFEEIATLKKAIQNCLAVIPEEITETDASDQNSYTIASYEFTEEEILPFQKAVLKYTPETDPYEKVAGLFVQAPFPISTYPYCEKNEGISGPFIEDRKSNHWFFAAGDDGGTSEVIMRFYYPVQPDYYFPNGSNNSNQIPLLKKDRDVPIDISYTVSWPDTPEMKVNQTLVESMYGLPAIKGQKSVDVIYQQSIENGMGESVILIDPSQTRYVFLEAIPDDIITEYEGAEKIIIGNDKDEDKKLSLTLRRRLSFDPLNQKLIFKGEIIDPVFGFDYALLNVMSDADYKELLALSTTEAWTDAVEELYKQTKEPIFITNSNTDIYNDLALTSGFAKGTGYVTLMMQNKDGLGALPVSLEIIEVIPELDPGEILVITPRCPFDETLTLRHRGDFAGRSDEFVFEWQYLGVEADKSENNIWKPYPNGISSVKKGAIDITIKGPGKFTLADNKFRCRYKYDGTDIAIKNLWSEWSEFSEWTEPQLAEGWIKRVIGDINSYTQRASGGGIQGAEDKFFSYSDKINAIVSMISQIGQRWEGNIPMNCDNINDYGLLEIYETVFKRGKDLSINDGPGYQKANDALLLVASRIADFYMLLGNEAYADSSDPTIGFGTDDGIYGQEASSLHCFMNQVPTLLDEELALLRGRNDDLLPGVRTSPIYNRLFWNFTGGSGEVAYALSYNILDVNNDAAGHIDEADAKQLFPQGHGDAWGHYLSAIKIYYQLLTHPNYDWNSRSEEILLGGIRVTVDFLDEQKFAEAAAAKARTGSEIVNLTYRKHFLMIWQMTEG